MPRNMARKIKRNHTLTPVYDEELCQNELRLDKLTVVVVVLDQGPALVIE
jgi:hypothetical protein